MPLPLLAGLAMSAVPAIFKGIKGIQQKKEAKNLKKNDFIPGALNQGIDRATVAANSNTLPGQARIEENIRQSNAGVIDAAGSGSFSDKLAVASAVDKQAGQTFEDLGVKAAENKQNNERMLQNLLTRKGDYQYQNEVDFQNRKQQLAQAGDQNLFGGLSDIASVGTSFLGPKMGQLNFKGMDPAKIKAGLDAGYIDPTQLDQRTLRQILSQ